MNYVGQRSIGSRIRNTAKDHCLMMIDHQLVAVFFPLFIFIRLSSCKLNRDTTTL